MAITNDNHLEALKAAILKLEPSGADGFEGLLAAVLTKICDQPFRLASSGSQRGRDGDSAFDAGATYFEAKRYSDEVPKKEIATKLMDLKIDNQGQVDTWILGATSEVPALNAKDFRELAEREGIGIVLLDWSDNAPLPALATVMAMGQDVTTKFLKDHLNKPVDAVILAGALAAIDHLVSIPEFKAQAATLQNELRNPSVGLGLAKAANRKWFAGVFSDRRVARQMFGQPLAPMDPAINFVQPRITLVNSLLPAFTGKPSSNVFGVIGPEGAGKSWLVANTWWKANPASLLLLVAGGELQQADILNFEDFLIRKLVAQTGGDLSEATQRRWRRRFAAWRANPNPTNIRVTLCLDGLNQNAQFPWHRLIDGAAAVLAKLGGQLIVTTRTTHFPTIRQAITPKISRVLVSEWSQSELDTILRTRGIDPNVLTVEVIDTLKNPRILKRCAEANRCKGHRNH
jgi:hypothetical protein